MNGLGFTIVAYALSSLLLFGYGLRVWMGYRSFVRRHPGGDA